MSANPKECPYHLGMSRQRINCTGIVPGTEIRQSYASPGMEKRNYTRYCGSTYHRCPIAQMLNTLYCRFQIHPCSNNSEVECLHPDQCCRCGWNPTVADARLADFLNHQDR